MVTRKYSFTFGFLLVWSSWISTWAHAQTDLAVTRYTDSLLRLAQQAPTDDQRFERYLELSFYWSDRDTTTAFGYLSEAKKAAGSHLTGFQVGLLYLYTANIVFTHDVERAKSVYMQADSCLAGYTSATAYRYRSKAWNNYGILFQVTDSAERYMRILIDRAIPYARLAGDSAAVGDGFLNIGLLLANVQDYRKADEYYRQAIHTYSKIPGSEEHKLTVFVNASRTAILARHFPRARNYLDSAAKVFKAIPHSAFAAHYLRNEGMYYRHMQQKDKALSMFREAIRYAGLLNDQQILRDIYFEMYAVYRDHGEYQSAKKYLKTANQYNPGAVTSDRLLHLREMAGIDYKLGNFKAAFEHMEAYALGKDTAHERNMALQIMDLEKKYETIEKENEILKLQDENQKQLLTINSNRIWIILLVAAFLMALITAFFSWKLAKSNQKTLHQKEQLHRQELTTLKQHEQLKQYHAVLQVQEEERNRIARDLHDGLGGLLAGVKLRLSTIAGKEREKPNGSGITISPVIADLDHAVNELRRIARNMMPEALLYMGLSPALADLCHYLGTGETRIQFQGIGLRPNYTPDVLIGVYRIVQELLNNAVRHAHASQIIVQCSDGDNHLFLTVEDDGQGFSAGAQPSNGLGLKSIENRVALLKGRIEIDSKPGRGTTVNVEIPIDDARTH